jgi:hypothetical protein
MGLYNTSSFDASVERKPALWKPCDLLEIINPDPGYQCITCVGYAPSQGRRCRNPIRADNRSFIMETLNEISYLPPDSSAVTSRLRAIASRALCVRWHQGQAASMVQQWQNKIQTLKPRSQERLHTKPAQSTSNKYAKPTHDLDEVQEQLRDMKRLLAELQEELRRQKQGDRAAEDRRQEQQESERQQEEEACKRRERERQERKDRERKAREQEEEEERREKERQEKEQQEKEEQEQKAREQAAHNERLRQKAQKRREEGEKKERERLQKERTEWDEAWTRYQDRWTTFRGKWCRAFPSTVAAQLTIHLLQRPKPVTSKAPSAMRSPGQ